MELNDHQTSVQPSSVSDYISLADAAKGTQYSQEYLSLRARQGKLKAEKIGRNWMTKRVWVDQYLDQTEMAKQELKQGVPSTSSKAEATQTKPAVVSGNPLNSTRELVGEHEHSIKPSQFWLNEHTLSELPHPRENSTEPVVAKQSEQARPTKPSMRQEVKAQSKAFRELGRGKGTVYGSVPALSRGAKVSKIMKPSIPSWMTEADRPMDSHNLVSLWDKSSSKPDLSPADSTDRAKVIPIINQQQPVLSQVIGNNASAQAEKLEKAGRTEKADRSPVIFDPKYRGTRSVSHDFARHRDHSTITKADHFWPKAMVTIAAVFLFVMYMMTKNVVATDRIISQLSTDIGTKITIGYLVASGQQNLVNTPETLAKLATNQSDLTDPSETTGTQLAYDGSGHVAGISDTQYTTLQKVAAGVLVLDDTVNKQLGSTSGQSKLGQWLRDTFDLPIVR